MIVHLLNPTLFGSPEDMVEQSAPAQRRDVPPDQGGCLPPGWSTLFARRWVHTESFVMSRAERGFYKELQVYLEDGFDLARRKGNQGRALGFVMTIFQKIAASSFAAVHRTLAAHAHADDPGRPAA